MYTFVSMYNLGLLKIIKGKRPGSIDISEH